MVMELFFSIQIQSLLCLLLLLFLLLLFAYFYLYFVGHGRHINIKNSTHKRSKQPSAAAAGGGGQGFKIYPILGALPEFLYNRHRFLEWTTQVLRRCPTKTSVFRRPGKVHGIMTANPENVEHMLKTNFQNYPKGDRFNYLLQDFLGEGIFNSDGELWKLQRKTASYEFNTKSLRNFVLENVVVEMDTRLLPTLEDASRRGYVVDLQDILERFAFDNVCKLAFNVDPACLNSMAANNATNAGAGAEFEFMHAFEEAATLSSGRFMYAFPIVWQIKKFLGVGSERRLRQAIHTVHKFADNIIRSRMEANSSSSSLQNEKDLLSRFIANEENNSPEFLRDIIISFILAGRDTTSSALSWFFWLLSSRPDVQNSILKELQAIRIQNTITGENNNTFYFSFNQLRDMQYLQAAISEAMRLYPPVPVDTKACLTDDIMPDGTFVGKDWFVTYHTYAMGRMETIWGKNYDEFVPERWLDDDGMCCQESPFRFPVFHAGPRMCLGKDMAYIQMKSIAATVIERFEIEVVNGDKRPEHLLSLTLRMKTGLPVKLTKRERL